MRIDYMLFLIENGKEYMESRHCRARVTHLVTRTGGTYSTVFGYNTVKVC